MPRLSCMGREMRDWLHIASLEKFVTTHYTNFHECLQEIFVHAFQLQHINDAICHFEVH